MQFFEDVLRIPNGPRSGEPFKLIDWQKDAVHRIYGDSPSPQVREFYLSLPKKNAKTTWAAGLVLYHLVREPNETRAEIYSSAASKEQAQLIWRAAESMVKYSPDLQQLVDSGRLEVFRDLMVYHARNGDRVYRSLANDAKGVHGINPSFVVVDEIHALRGAKDQEQLDVFTQSGVTRANPLVVYLTHAGTDLNSIAAEKERLIAKYENGVLDKPPGFAYRIYRASDQNPWDSEEAFREANPAYPELISHQAFLDAVDRARQTPNFKRSYMCFNLNLWQGSSESLVNLEDWKASADVYSAEDLYGRACYAGFDASTYDDLTAFMLVFPPEEGESGYRVLTHAFIPEDRLQEKELRDQVPYWEWSQQGHVHLTPGAVIDEDCVIDTILDASEKFEIREFVYDPHKARHIVKRLDEAGISTVEHRTGIISMSDPTAQFVKHVIAHTLRHDGNPVLAWNVGNLQARVDQVGNTAPKKGKHTEKIDCAFALILALGRALVGEFEESLPSVYEERGLLLL